MNNVADVILFFDLPLGKEALVVKFWGADARQAIDTASDPYTIPSEHVRGTVDVFQRQGYTAYGNINPGFQATICVRESFDLFAARLIAKQFFSELGLMLKTEFGESA